MQFGQKHHRNSQLHKKLRIQHSCCYSCQIAQNLSQSFSYAGISSSSLTWFPLFFSYLGSLIFLFKFLLCLGVIRAVGLGANFLCGRVFNGELYTIVTNLLMGSGEVYEELLCGINTAISLYAVVEDAPVLLTDVY